jgi:6-phosphogluconolactonase (cycloisomerase 2 family)
MFTATPNTGYNVDQWLVDGTLVQTGGTTFTLNNVTADHTVEVTFTIQTFTVTPSTGGNGSISPSTPQTVNYGSSVMFTATPNANFQVNQWLVDGTVVQTEGTTYTLSNVTANHTVQVTFIRVALLYVASASSIVSVCTLNANDTVNTCSTAANGFFAASGISINPAGTIAYVVDAGTAIYYCPVNANGTLGTCNDTGSGGATFPFVLRIDFNPAGTLAYVSNGAGSQDIFYCTLNADGSFNVCTLSTPSGTTLGAPVGMWVNPANSIIYIADSTQQSATYCAIVSGGNLGTCGAASQLFNNPREVLLNVAGTFLYVSDIDGNQLYYCVVNGDGSLGACNTTGTGFNRPDGLATNLAGTVLYIGNNGSKVVFACPINANGTLGTCVSKSITAGVADVYYLP